VEINRDAVAGERLWWTQLGCTLTRNSGGLSRRKEVALATVLVQHRVANYSTWRTVYESFDGVQKELGVIEESVFQAKGDSNNVLVLHRFASMSDAEKFMESPKLREAMTQGGIVGQPRIEFYEEALAPVRA
jgi:quinol monooxygenase YgiN